MDDLDECYTTCCSICLSASMCLGPLFQHGMNRMSHVANYFRNIRTTGVCGPCFEICFNRDRWDEAVNQGRIARALNPSAFNGTQPVSTEDMSTKEDEPPSAVQDTEKPAAVKDTQPTPTTAMSAKQEVVPVSTGTKQPDPPVSQPASTAEPTKKEAIAVSTEIKQQTTAQPNASTSQVSQVAPIVETPTKKEVVVGSSGDNQSTIVESHSSQDPQLGPTTDFPKSNVAAPVPSGSDHHITEQLQSILSAAASAIATLTKDRDADPITEQTPVPIEDTSQKVEHNQLPAEIKDRDIRTSDKLQAAVSHEAHAESKVTTATDEPTPDPARTTPHDKHDN